MASIDLALLVFSLECGILLFLVQRKQTWEQKQLGFNVVLSGHQLGQCRRLAASAWFSLATRH